MNTPTSPETSHETQETAHLEKLRLQITHDIEAMQQKEASLREYEQRLRLLVEHAHQAQSHAHPAAAPSQYSSAAPTGTASTAEIDAEWEKYHRAHALLEAARRGLADDRLALKDREEKLQQREELVSRREAWVKVREQELEALEAAAKTKATPKAKKSSVAKASLEMTTAPFIAARNLLMHRKA